MFKDLYNIVFYLFAVKKGFSKHETSLKFAENTRRTYLPSKCNDTILKQPLNCDEG